MNILQGEEILPSDQSRIIKQVKITYSPLGKAFEKQTEKQIGSIRFLDIPNKKR